MKFIADLHFHSRYSRATSPRADLDNFNKWAKKKGIEVVGTSDFTHPQWFRNLKEKLEPAEPGLFQLEQVEGEAVKFMLTTEVSCVYSKNSKTRKIHVLILAPDFDTVEEINTRLGWEGKLESDGRPTLGMDAEELTKIVLNTSEDCMVIPAHCMTPWFGLFGSKSGFDSLEACFGDYSEYIQAVETGLSADPPMLWRIPDTRKRTLFSASDAHSPKKLGREVNIFEGENLSYEAITGATKKGAEATQEDALNLIETIEFYPQEGRYHYDGHRKCGVRFSPQQTEQHDGVCPECGEPLTIGVMNRVERLADREKGFEPDQSIPFRRLIPLEEIVAEAVGQNTGTKAVEEEYQNLINNLGSEFRVLLESSIKDLKNLAGPKIAEGIRRVREEEVQIEPGYDGEYGEIKVFSEEEDMSAQKTLFDS